MWNFAKLDTTPLNSPLSLFSASCRPQTVKYHNENPLSCHPLPLKLLPTCENIGLQSHLGPRNSQAHSSTPHPHQICTPGDPSHAHSHTPDAPLPRTHNPSPPQIRMQFPNRSDSAIQSDTNKQAAQRELHAKLLSTCHGSTSRSPPRGPPWGLRGLAAVPVRGGRARTRTHARLEAVAEPAGPGRGAGGWRQGLAGLRDDAPGHTPATRRRRCGGRRRDRRARAGFEIDHSEPQARVWRSRGRPGPPAPGTPAAQQATPEIWRDHSHNRQRPGRLLHNSPHGSSPRRPRRISHYVRPIASHARSYRLG